jgi:hypothetical protein
MPGTISLETGSLPRCSPLAVRSVRATADETPAHPANIRTGVRIREGLDGRRQSELRRGPGQRVTTPARPGKSPFEMARPGSGARTEEASTKAMEPLVPLREPSSYSPARPAARTRPSRTLPRKTLSNADRQASSPVSATVPLGDPPTLISAPSRRPNRSRAVAISSPAAAGLALSATTYSAAPGVASG